MQGNESFLVRLLLLVERYETAVSRWLEARDASSSSLEMDATFAALRLQQKVRWPDGSAAVDEVGLRAQDLLLAGTHRGRSSAAARDAAGEHAQALARLKSRIALVRSGLKEAA
jgi:hypothetical protein